MECIYNIKTSSQQMVSRSEALKQFKVEKDTHITILWLHLKDVASDGGTAVSDWWVPFELHGVLIEVHDLRQARRSRFVCWQQ